MKSQSGFTLIELVVVIVVLGILAAVAVPKYVDLKTDAEVAQANGVYAAAQSGAALNFAGNLLGKGLTAVTDGASLKNVIDELPTGWDAGTGTDVECIVGTINTNSYKVCVATDEDSDSKAVLSKDW